MNLLNIFNIIYNYIKYDGKYMPVLNTININIMINI